MGGMVITLATVLMGMGVLCGASAVLLSLKRAFE